MTYHSAINTLLLIGHGEGLGSRRVLHLICTKPDLANANRIQWSVKGLRYRLLLIYLEQYPECPPSGVSAKEERTQRQTTETRQLK